MVTNTINEEKATAASYIISFYQEVMLLNQHHANYVNVLAEISAKYGEKDSTLEIDERNILTLAAQNLRNAIQKCHIQYMAIAKNIKPIQNKVKEKEEKTEKELRELFKKIIETFIIKADDSSEYVIFLNTFLVKKVMKSILENSQEIVSKMYS